jgi:hypothetical protein
MRTITGDTLSRVGEVYHHLVAVCIVTKAIGRGLRRGAAVGTAVPSFMGFHTTTVSMRESRLMRFSHQGGDGSFCHERAPQSGGGSGGGAFSRLGESVPVGWMRSVNGMHGLWASRLDGCL